MYTHYITIRYHIASANFEICILYTVYLYLGAAMQTYTVRLQYIKRLQMKPQQN
jgi:hypothetical protein